MPAGDDKTPLSYEELQQRNEELTSKNEELSRRNEELNRKDDALIQRNEELNQRDEVLRSSNEILKESNDTLTFNNKTLKKRNDVLQKNVEALQEENEVLQRKYEALQQNYEVLRMNNDVLTTSKQDGQSTETSESDAKPKRSPQEALRKKLEGDNVKKMGIKINVEVRKREVEQILLLIQAKEGLKQSEIMQTTKLSRTTSDRLIGRMMKMGWIYRAGGKKFGGYALTADGKKLFEE